MKRSELRPARLAALALLLAAACHGPVRAAGTAATAPIPTGARLAATCAACHGTAGATVGLKGGSGPIPALAGQSREALSSSLRAFKAGTRQSTIMTQIAKGYTDEQIELLSAYFAAQKKGG
jgi:sulfide dehydrogenase cytochrome subunit